MGPVEIPIANQSLTDSTCVAQKVRIKLEDSLELWKQRLFLSLGLLKEIVS